jgi:hypothetical protein
MAATGEKLKELPSFLSVVSMVFDDEEMIVQKLCDAERKSPPFYQPAREFFCSILNGGFSFKEAIDQAERLPNPTERSCALDILHASKDYLTDEVTSRVTKVDFSTRIPNGMKLKVSPIWIRELDKPRFLVLHFWRTSLTELQTSAAAAILKMAAIDSHRELSSYGLDFISASLNTSGQRRVFSCMDWKRVRPLSENDLARFWKRFISAWENYQKRPARPHRVKKSESLF